MHLHLIDAQVCYGISKIIPESEWFSAQESWAFANPNLLTRFLGCSYLFNTSTFSFYIIFNLAFKFFTVFVYVCVLCVCMHICRRLKRPEEGVRFPEAGVKGGLLWFDQGRFLKSWRHHPGHFRFL